MTVPRKKAEPQEAASIEENFARLEEIIKRLEAGEESLEETFAGYEAGMKLKGPACFIGRQGLL